MVFTLGTLPPAPAELAAAVAAAPRADSTWFEAGPGDTHIDFAALFPRPPHRGLVVAGHCLTDPEADPAGPDGCGACDQPLSARLAWLIAEGADTVVDAWEWAAQEDPDYFDIIVAGTLPPVALRYAQEHPGWLARFLATVRDTGLRVLAGQVPTPSSTAEEMALHVALDAAEGYLDSIRDAPTSGWGPFDLLPAHAATGERADDLTGTRETGTAGDACKTGGSGTPSEPAGEPGRTEGTRKTRGTRGTSYGGALHEGLDELRECLFLDHDVLLLFQPELAGIESDRDLARQMGAVNLHPADWFTPFRV